MKAVVVGAGAVGFFVALAAARRGIEVTLVDAGTAGAGGSAHSLAWINSNGKEPRAYFDLNLRGLEKWVGDFGGHPSVFVQSGHVEFARDDTAKWELANRLERLRELGYPASLVTVDAAAELLPGFRHLSRDDVIAHFPSEGYVHTAPLFGVLRARALAADISLIEHFRVATIVTQRGGIKVTSDDRRVIEADVVVSCLGGATSDLVQIAHTSIPMADGPGDPVHGYLAMTAPAQLDLGPLLTTPHLTVRPAGGGRLMLQAKDLDVHASSGKVADHVRHTLEERLAQLLDDQAAPRVEVVDIGERAIPADGLTVSGWMPGVPGLYVAVTHSGITLAPVLGELVASELLGQDQASLASFRPDRFTSPKKSALSIARRPPARR